MNLVKLKESLSLVCIKWDYKNTVRKLLLNTINFYIHISL